MAAAPRVGCGREVLEVQVAPPREAVAHPEAGDRDGVLLRGKERAQQPVAGGAQELIDIPGDSSASASVALSARIAG